MLKMKKYLLFIIALALSFGLIACGDQKTYNESVQVYFFTANRGASIQPTYENLSEGDLIEEPENPTRIGYEFNGWYIDKEKTILWDFDSDILPDQSIILYAGWVPGVYNIYYDTNGGEILAASYPTEFNVGDSFVLPTPSRTGYSFVAWYEYDWVDETSTIPGDPGYIILPSEEAKDVYLYAHWEAAIVSLIFRVNYPLAEGAPSSPSNRIVRYGDILELPILDDTADYTFVGWNSKSDGEGEWYNTGDVFTRTQRTSLYAIWEEIV